MLSISTPYVNSDGHVLIENTSQCTFGRKTFRVSRAATLDGGAVNIHSGYSDGDRTFTIAAMLTKAQELLINSLAELYTYFIFAIDDGVFYGSISSMTAENGVLAMSIYVESKET